MLSHRRFSIGNFGDECAEWWGYYHGTWVQVTLSSFYDREYGGKLWAWSIVRSLGKGSGRRAFVGASDEDMPEATAVREAFDALRREVRS